MRGSVFVSTAAPLWQRILRMAGPGLVEAIVLGLIVTIGVCFAVELAMIHFDWSEVARGLRS